MKKRLALLLTFAMVMTFSACGAKEEIPSATVDPTDSATIDTTTDTTIDETVDPTVDVTVDTPVDEPVDTTVHATITAKDCFGDAGYVEFVSGAEKSADYTFTAEHSEGAKWRVYVLDEEFDDGFRFIAQAAQPVLEGDGTISVAEGQFVYVYCSVNSFTADVADENAKLNVTIS